MSRLPGNALVGAGVFVAALVPWQMATTPPTPPQMLMGLGVLVVVPLGLAALAAVGSDERMLRRIGWLVVPCGVSAVASFALAPGGLAAVLALPWFAVTVLLALSAVVALPRLAWRDPAAWCLLVARMYLQVGGAWFVASRAGLTPLGFHEPIVLLTGVHFHFAACAAPILAGRLIARVRDARADRLIWWLLAAGIGVGPALLGIGFVISPGMKLLGAGVVSVSVALLAIITLLWLERFSRPWARRLHALSATCGLLGMLLAAVYAVGEWNGQWWLTIGDMESSHGLLNGIGLAALGLLAWCIEDDVVRAGPHRLAPTDATVQRFVAQQAGRPLSYQRSIDPAPGGFLPLRGRVEVGSGDAVFERVARCIDAFAFVPAFARPAPWHGPQPGAEVALVSRQLGFHLMNVCRVVERIDEPARRGFVYATIDGHWMRGAEHFLVERDASGLVFAEIASVSQPVHPLAWLGVPVVRRLQRRFVREALARLAAVAREGNN